MTIERIIIMTAIGVQAGLSELEVKVAIKSDVSIEESARQHGVAKIDERLTEGIEILKDELKP